MPSDKTLHEKSKDVDPGTSTIATAEMEKLIDDIEKLEQRVGAMRVSAVLATLPAYFVLVFGAISAFCWFISAMRSFPLDPWNGAGALFACFTTLSLLAASTQKPTTRKAPSAS